MGTNYYLNGKPAYSHCGRRAARGLHIGKSSGGWAFSLRIYPTGDWHTEELEMFGVEAIDGLSDWMPLFYAHGVTNEYGDDVTPTDMVDCIVNRSHPNGLQHHLSFGDGYRVRPGADTYDLIIGEFS